MFRVVGFVEYAAALQYLDQLVARANDQELQAIDELIRERREFTVYVNLAGGLVSGRSTIVDSRPEALAAARSGLPWVLALARVELGGIVATFASHPAPFGLLPITRVEAQAYAELLMDGAQSHYWSLTRDPVLGRVAESEPGRPMLAYIRRLSVAQKFLLAAAGARARTFNGPQAAELTQQDQQLRRIREQFQGAVKDYLAANTFTETRSQSTPREFAVACQAQLAGEQRELQLGTARVERFSQP